ncbi:MAG: RidA family protein [Chloroflexota bacterium]|nr:RidA family protein [Chloroflexota bacterium]
MTGVPGEEYPRSDDAEAQVTIERRIKELGIELPDFSIGGYTGLRYGTVKPHHRVGSLLFLSGHLPEYPDGTILHPGRLGDNVTIEQGYEAARLAGMNAVAGLKFALGDLDNVVGIVRSLNFVVCTPDFHDIHRVANGSTDLFQEIFGAEAGIGGRATVGIVSLARMHCFENWLTVEVRD